MANLKKMQSSKSPTASLHMPERRPRSPGQAAKRTGNLSASPRSKKKQIVKAATKVFLSQGYEGTSVANVAAAAKVIKATIYSHFKDKDALFKAVMEGLTVEKGIMEMEVSSTTLLPEPFFDHLALRMLDRVNDPQFRALLRVVIGESGRFPEISQLFYETVSCRGNRLIAKYIKEHPELGIPDPPAAAQIVTGSIVYWMLSQEVMGGKNIEKMDPQRIIKTLKYLFINRAEVKEKAKTSHVASTRQSK